MEEHADFMVGLQRFGKDWQLIAELVKTRTHVQTRTHHQKYEQQLKKGRPFPEEVGVVELSAGHFFFSSAERSFVAVAAAAAAVVFWC